MYIYNIFYFSFYYSWCDVLQDFLNLINVDVDVDVDQSTERVEKKLLQDGNNMTN